MADVSAASLDVCNTSINYSRLIIVLVGYPGSGKTTFATKLMENLNSQGQSAGIVNGDLCKTEKKVLAETTKLLNVVNVVIVDATNVTLERRRSSIDLGQQAGVPVGVVWLTTSIQICMERVKQRVLEGGRHVPNVAFYTLRKKFIEPSLEEGFCFVHTIDDV
jgi:predicted kinase